jgi:hydrogenase maturation protease
VNEPAWGDDPPVHRRVAVVGLGNVLLGDDGLGPFVVRHFEARYDYPPWVSVSDLGTPGLDLVPFVADATALIVVDTILLDEPPGTLRLYRQEQLLAAPRGQRLSPHDPGLVETLQMLAFCGDGPREVLLVGVVPHLCAPRPGLSAAARAAAEQAVEMVAEELRRMGVPLIQRLQPLEADIFWERSLVREGEAQ